MTAYDWANPSAGGNFSDPSNWVIAENGDPATNPPGPGDTAIIDNNAGITVTMGGATVEWLSIGPIGSGTYLDGSFDVTSGLNAGQGVVLENGSVSAGQIVGITNQNDTINANILSNSTILGGTVNVSTFQSSTVSSGTVNADEISSASIFGGTVTAGIFDDDVIGGGTVSGYSLMNGSISGGTVTLTGGLGFVAVSGGNVQCETLDGPITLLGGTISADDDYPSPSLEIYVSSGALIINSMELAAYASATITDGTLTVSGPLSVFSQLVQGFPAVGRLTVDGSGSAIIEGQATIANGAYILVGSVLPYLPEGYLQLDSGLSIAGTGLTFLEVMADGDADIGGNTTVDGSQASISVTDSGSELTADAVVLGSGGGLAVTSNATAEFSGDLTVGAGGPGIASLLLTNSGALTVDGNVDIGLSIGDGSASLQSGSTLSVTQMLQIGGAGLGYLTVAGSGTDVITSGITVGDSGLFSGGKGTLTVLSGAHISGAVVNGGGYAVASTGGVLESSVINSGGSERIVGQPRGPGAIPGGIASGDTIVSGGTLELFEQPAGSGQSAGTVSSLVSGGIVFEGSGGLLKVDGATISADTLSGSSVISGFTVGDTIDLSSVSFSSGGAVCLTSGNVLEVVERGGTAYLQLDPSQDFSDVSFRLSDDGRSGTEITVVSGLSINLSYDSSVAKAPGGYDGEFTSAMAKVVSTLESNITNPDTLNISVGWGEADGSNSAVSGGGAASIRAAGPSYTYSDILSGLAEAGGPQPMSGGSNSPYQSGAFANGIADAQALDLGGSIDGITVSNDDVPIDGWIGFSTASKWSFNGGISPGGAEDLIGIAEHEITEVMGRVSYIGSAAGFYDPLGNNTLVTYPGAYSPMDLFRYAGPGDPDTTQAGAALENLLSDTAGVGLYPTAYPAGYFSLDSGTTDLGNWNNYAPAGDIGDWYPPGAPVKNDSFNYEGDAGQAPLSTNDLELMNAIGWQLASAPNPPSHVAFFNAEVTSGNVLNVSSGGAASGTFIFSGGTMTVQSGGFATITIVSGGTETISAGGKDTTGRISGGSQLVYGLASGATVFSNGWQVVEAGGAANGTKVSSGGTVELLGNGTVGGLIAKPGGTIEVNSGATLPNYSISSGVTVDVFSAGSAFTTTVLFGGKLTVLSGGTATATKISNGEEIIGGGGRDNGAVISKGAQYVFGGASGAIVSSGGSQVIGAGGVALSTRISGGTQIVLAGGSADPTVILKGGTEIVESGGADDGAQISGGTQLVYGVTDNSTVFAGRQIVGMGGTASETTVSTGGTVKLLGGAISDDITINAGGTLAIASGYLLSGFDVGSGATFVLSSGGMTTDLTIESGGHEILSGGTTLSSGLVSGLILGKGVILAVSGGTVVSTIVLGGAIMELLGATIESGGVVSAGGQLVVSNGSVDSATTLPKGATETVSSGGTAAGVVVSGGTLQILLGGIAQSTVVSSAGGEAISGGGTDDGAQIGKGGRQLDYGLASAVVISSGGSQVVEGGGTTIGANIAKGGTVTVSSGGVFELTSGHIVSGMTLLPHATLVIDSAAVLQNFVVSNGVSLEVLSGAMASGTTVKSAGTEIIDFGGVVNGLTISGGGTLELLGGTTSAIPAGVTLLLGSILAAGSGETFSGFAIASGSIVEILSAGAALSATIGSGGKLIVAGHGSDSGTTISKSSVEIVLSGGSAAAITLGSGGAVIVGSGGAATIASAGSGTINVSGANAIADLSGSVISGGLLETSVGGQVDVYGAGNLLHGATVNGTALAEGGTLTISGGTLSAGAIIEALSSGTIAVSGTVNNGGTLYALSSGGVVEVTSGAVVKGGVVEIGNGIVDVQSGGSTSVTFLSSGSGGLEIDAVGSGAFTGVITEFGGSSHSNHTQFIELAGVADTGNVVGGSYSGNTKSGVLTVSSSATIVAAMHLAGNYLSTHFTFSSGGDGTIITDPAGTVVNGGSMHHSKHHQAPTFPAVLPNLPFAAQDTLGYPASAEHRNADPGGPNIGLIGSLMAGFVTSEGSNGGTVNIDAAVTDPLAQIANPGHH